MVTVYWFPLVWCHFDLVKWVKFGGSGHFLENTWREWPEIKHADVSWPPSEMKWLVYSHGLLIILILALFWLSWMDQIWGFASISQRTHGGNGLKFFMLIYLDYLQNWSVYGHGLLIFLILALFWLSETGQIWGFQAFRGERMEGIVCNFACCCILTTFRTD